MPIRVLQIYLMSVSNLASICCPNYKTNFSYIWNNLFPPFEITEEELNAGKSTEGATSLVNISNLSHTDNDNTAIDESDLFGALSESDDEPQVRFKAAFRTPTCSSLNWCP